MAELVRYDAMCHAIAECHSVDEVRDLKDKARALELYAKQSRNTDAERRACEIRLRAERRTGELLKELARATPAQSGAKGNAAMGRVSNDATCDSPYAEALQRTGISRQSASRYQALAEVPAATFEAALREPDKPTTNALLSRAAAMRAVNDARDGVPQIDKDALWLWGRARDFERDGFATKDAARLLQGMTETMQCDMARIAPLMAEFFTRMQEVAHEPA